MIIHPDHPIWAIIARRAKATEARLQAGEAMVREAEELIRALYDVIVRRVAKIDSELFDLLFETLSFLKMLGVQLPPEEKP